jgi:hypothetical protein
VDDGGPVKPPKHNFPKFEGTLPNHGLIVAMPTSLYTSSCSKFGQHRITLYGRTCSIVAASISSDDLAHHLGAI